ncbi:MAG TPA: hypothetical protein VJ506_08570, partial [Candidatus Limnocylindrales bacterium]|nr:hypothetical protein [Candidatus Limnocylindrales bacterium]
PPAAGGTVVSGLGAEVATARATGAIVGDGLADGAADAVDTASLLRALPDGLVESVLLQAASASVSVAK